MLRRVFGNQTSLSELHDWTKNKDMFADTRSLGTFFDNADYPRILSLNNGDVSLLKNTLVFMLTYLGIPSVYYGTEQYLDGGGDPYNKEALWLHGYNTSSDMYNFMRRMNLVRLQTQLYKHGFHEHTYKDNFYSYTNNGIATSIVTNVGSHGSNFTARVYLSYDYDTYLCNILAMPTAECYRVDITNAISVPITNGLPVVLMPTTQIKSWML
eukprot:TRINITY_DN1092_c0_g1_i2.p1 TRINITY_DN1092_c0_g1~~TRINITY_DN1092_c0_g1_i2.p1  ORF type:complete len:212 (-),score=36.15 TRINITY_DN1092_c0_g1_i2:56-691(-)